MAAIIAIIFWFVRQALAQDRLRELVYTTLALFCTWYLMFFIKDLDPVFYWVPFAHYVAIWVYLLVFRRKRYIYKTCKHWGDEDWWWALDGWEFEEEVAKVFEMNGYKAEVTKKTGDGGIDIILYKDRKKYIVQCKHYVNEVGPEPVRALYGVKEDFNADELIMVASSGVTRASKEFISSKSCYQVLDLKDIMRLAADAYSS